MENCLEKVFVGVDCHKDTIACYLNGNFKEFKTNHNGYTKAVEWVNKINPNSAWAIEGAFHTALLFLNFFFLPVAKYINSILQFINKYTLLII